ncbi:Dabb family protein [Tomitella biformata]|uniref:Dabb family protein n=1 Tax=Tomitella biformata TaxID=630403 RepID=UPI000465C4A1|nr:Dabb family protein [Tomitella biformata]
MSFTHIVAFSFNEGSDAAARAAEALNALAPTVAEVKEFRCGPDAGVSAGNADFGIVAVFDDEASYEVYRDHPEHQRIIKEILVPNLTARTCVQLRS